MDIAMENEELLRLLLFLLTDADLVHGRFRVRESFMIVTRHCLGEVGVHVRFIGENRHQREGIVAGRAERAKPLDIGDSHNLISIPD